MLKRIILALIVSIIFIPRCVFSCGGEGEEPCIHVDPSDYHGFRRYMPSAGVYVNPNASAWNKYWSNFTVVWDIELDATQNAFHYVYTIGHTNPYASSDPDASDVKPICGNLSHFILQVSDEFGYNDIFGLTAADLDELKTFTSGPGNPGLPGDIYGLKFDGFQDGQVATIDFFSQRVPEWGDFYAKDGGGGGCYAVYAYNMGFGSTPEDPFGNWIPRPDCTVVPEPSTMMILGSSLVAVAWRRRKKRS